MAVSAYAGLPGSGKSHSIVEFQVLPALKQGRRVVCNIPLNADSLAADFPGADVVQVTHEQVASDGFFADAMLKGAVVILDECWRYWPAGLRADKIPPAHKQFFAEHRHMVDDQGNSTQIVLATQDFSQVAAFIRQLVETTYVCTNLGYVGKRGSFRVDVYTGCQSGKNIPERFRTNQLFGSYREDVWRYYKSATHSATGSVGNEKRIDSRGSIWRNKQFLLMLFGAPIVVIFALFMASKSFFALASDKEPAPDPVAVSVAPVATPAVYKSLDGVQPKMVELSRVWTLSGFIMSPKAQWAIFQTFNGVTRIHDAAVCVGRSLHSAVCRLDGEYVSAWSGPLQDRQLGAVPVDASGQPVYTNPVKSSGFSRIESSANDSGKNQTVCTGGVCFTGDTYARSGPRPF